MKIHVRNLTVIKIDYRSSVGELSVRSVGSVSIGRIQVSSERAILWSAAKQRDCGIDRLFKCSATRALDDRHSFHVPAQSRDSAREEKRIVAVASQNFGPGLEMGVPVGALGKLGQRFKGVGSRSECVFEKGRT